MKWTNYEIEYLKNNYKVNGVDYCVEGLGCNRRRIISKANLMGLKTDVVNKRENLNKSSVNYNLFNTTMTKESVYILGLLWADGHVRKENKTTSISCVQTDIDEVTTIFLKTGDWLISKPIKKYFNGDEVKTQKKIHTTTWGLFEILKDYGFLCKTTSSPNDMLIKIPNKLKKYWFRGYLDGDGCIKLGKKYGVEVVFTGPYNQKWDFMVDLCCQLKIDYSIDNRKIKEGGYSHFRINKKNHVKIISDYIYNDYDNIGFSRKYKKYLNVCEYIKTKNKLFWSDEDVIWLTKNYKLLGGVKCAKLLGKTLNCVYNKIRLLNKCETILN